METLTISQTDAEKFVDALHGEDFDPCDVEEAAEEIWALSHFVDGHGGLEGLAERLRGRDGGLRPSKPTADEDNGLTRYLWRMARFHSGRDTSMPVTASIWLQGFLDEKNIDASVSGVLDEEGKAITDYLEAVVDNVLVELGESPAKAARTWKATGIFG